MGFFHRILGRTNRFLRKDQDGAATVEAVLWMPVFIIIFGLIVDASLLFNTQAHLTRLVQDANRSFSIGRLDTAADTEAYILARVGAASGDPDTSVVTTVNNGIINTTITVEAGHYMAIGIFTALTNLNLSVTSQHMMET